MGNRHFLHMSVFGDKRGFAGGGLIADAILLAAPWRLQQIFWLGPPRSLGNHFQSRGWRCSVNRIFSIVSASGNDQAKQ